MSEIVQFPATQKRKSSKRRGPKCQSCKRGDIELCNFVVNLGKGEMFFRLCKGCSDKIEKRIVQVYGVHNDGPSARWDGEPDIWEGEDH